MKTNVEVSGSKGNVSAFGFLERWPGVWRTFIITLGDLNTSPCFETLLFKPEAYKTGLSFVCWFLFCFRVKFWREIPSRWIFQLLRWHNHTSMPGNQMVYFPSSYSTGKDTMLRCVIKLLLHNELFTSPNTERVIMSWSYSNVAWLFLHTLRVICYKVGFHVRTVILQRWILLNVCNVNSACCLPGTKKGRLDLTKHVSTCWLPCKLANWHQYNCFHGHMLHCNSVHVSRARIRKVLEHTFQWVR